MRKVITLALGVFLVTAASFASAAGHGVSNGITGAPGNSSAAHSPLGDTNCVGDVMSYNAHQQNGLGHTLSGGAPHGGVTGLISSIVTLGSMVWGTGMDCADFIANQPPPPPPPPGGGGPGL